MPYGRAIKSGLRWGVHIKPDVYPLVVCVSAGSAFGVYTIWHHLSSNPDVRVSPASRSTVPWESEGLETSGNKWKAAITKHYRHKDNEIGQLSAAQAFSPRYWSQRREVASDPLANAVAKARSTMH